jgi:hypothetical protein
MEGPPSSMPSTDARGARRRRRDLTENTLTLALSIAPRRLYSDYIVPTSLHIPKPLLAEVDRRAHHLRISRNRFIVQTLEKEVADQAHWSPGFFERLADVDARDIAAVKDLEASIRAARTRKGPPRL